MDWLNARSFRRLGSIKATLSVGTDDEVLDGDPLVLVGVELEFELQAAAVSATATPATSMTGRRRWRFMASSNSRRDGT